jgi:hypothetical protein
MARESADGARLYYSKIERRKGFFRMRLPPAGSTQREEVVVAPISFNAGATWVLGAHELLYYPSEQEGSTAFPSVRAIDLQLRLVVELRVFEGLSIEECADRLGCSVSTVTRNWRFAKRWLQSRLSPAEIPSDGLACD